MKTYRITCKKKHARFERVEEIGCIDFATRAEARFTEVEAVRLIESGAARFVVSDDRGNESVVLVESLRLGHFCDGLGSGQLGSVYIWKYATYVNLKSGEELTMFSDISDRAKN